MKEYTEFPPVKYFLRVLKSCPKSALLYVEIWKRKNQNMDLCIDKKDIRKEYLISPTMFRNLMAPLTFLNLVNFNEGEEMFQMEFVGKHTND